MGTFEALLLSLVQGVAEWLPISSDGHLVLFEKLFDIQEANLSFDVFLHLASLLLMLLFFRKQIIEIIRGFFNRKLVSGQTEPRKNWWWLIILSSFFTAIVAYYLSDKIAYFRTINDVGNWLFITSIFLLASKFSRGEKSIGWKEAVILGIFQGFAVLPGLSRSGTVIAMALVMKIKKEDAFDYGFIVAIPAIIGAFLLTVKDFHFESIYILAFIATFIISYFSLKLLKLIMKRDYFYLFFIYTLILSLIIKLN
ncbi:MAG: hypothetical protein A2406_04075 [Candidatus Komeilibacteria bacterium RIFOXYC1_FULL_37_11]|uniref:Undecaprenyl-diphosphatase n=1 Tax=Candidatus Komeilibacteria bacterium RIFOXYC1_FULL_37_11 TaxID=1798555 RepID=A0A1G2BX44_9BACT|nr:MAG: hypothetical protein A2406_04075 [Candidatus Komeilibacteria bacterium RIFOXYC1_FULL_37_11]OGY95841.1 MAG: hypothetical protein A2611_03645 [Candidatus Komeilibacteria bacterium RIFOXYD1_FULL_37_29]